MTGAEADRNRVLRAFAFMVGDIAHQDVEHECVLHSVPQAPNCRSRLDLREYGCSHCCLPPYMSGDIDSDIMVEPDSGMKITLLRPVPLPRHHTLLPSTQILLNNLGRS